MAVLGHLEPNRVFAFFEEISAIPHGSGHTKEISDYLVRFAQERNLTYRQDEWNNVIIWKDKSDKHISQTPIILQGHMDMVCEKAEGCTKDMEKEGLTLAIDGDAVYAEGTTLGGDDGIAVAMMLAILDGSEDHPPLECIFTTDEETGMDGAQNIKLHDVKGRTLINIDSEDEGVFTVSCAGGAVVHCVLPVTYEPFEGTAAIVTVSGLIGGHSGVEIHKGRANSNITLGRILEQIEQSQEMRIISVKGGEKDNAIPVRSCAHIIVKDYEKLEMLCKAQEERLLERFGAADPNLRVTVQRADEALPMDTESTYRLERMLTALPNGVQAMSQDIDGLVETSLNLGILTTKQDYVEASFCVRSSAIGQKEKLIDRVEQIMYSVGGKISVEGDYPAWQYRPHSLLRDTMIQVFEKQYGYAPKIEAIHAGVECGLFCGKLMALDCISFGPNLTEIHTPREKMSISSVQRTWQLLLGVLSEL